MGQGVVFLYLFNRLNAWELRVFLMIFELLLTFAFSTICLIAALDSLNYDPQRVAMDYHIIGFRECAAEVARYLVTIEGMDIQDPLRLRLMSHLQYFSQQREISASGGYQPNCAATPYQSYAPAGSASAYVPSSSSAYMNPSPHHVTRSSVATTTSGAGATEAIPSVIGPLRATG